MLCWGNVLVVALGLSCVFVFTQVFLGEQGESDTWDVDSWLPFECGLLPYNNLRLGFSVQFIAVALVFIVFDLEVLFLLMVLWGTGGAGSLYFCGLFISFVLIGLVWEASSGVICWVLWVQPSNTPVVWCNYPSG